MKCYEISESALDRISIMMTMIEDDIINDSSANEEQILFEISAIRHYFKALAQGGNNEF